MSSFQRDNMRKQYNILGYRTDLYIHDYKLAIETDKTWHSDRNIDYEMSLNQISSCYCKVTSAI